MRSPEVSRHDRQTVARHEFGERSTGHASPAPAPWASRWLEAAARNPSAAIEHYQRARENFLAIDPVDELRAAEALQNLIGPNLVLQRFDAARELATQAVDELASILGEEHPRAINARGNLAIATVQTGDREGGRAQLEKTLELWGQVRGADSSEYDQGRYNLGYFHLEGGEFERAIPLLEQSYRFRRDTFGEESIAVTFPAFSLATAYRETGRLEESLAMARLSLRNDERILGPDHEDVGWDLTEVAMTLRAMGRTAEADSIQARADRIFEKLRAEAGAQR